MFLFFYKSSKRGGESLAMGAPVREGHVYSLDRRREVDVALNEFEEIGLSPP